MKVKSKSLQSSSYSLVTAMDGFRWTDFQVQGPSYGSFENGECCFRFGWGELVLHVGPQQSVPTTPSSVACATLSNKQVGLMKELF